MDAGNHGMLKAELQKSIQKLEEVWESEVSTLKHELWQTIQAHNHNADLLKHHKDAIDSVQSKMQETAQNSEYEAVHAQLVQYDKVMAKEDAKEQQVDLLIQRLTAVQQQLQSLWAGPVPGFGGLPPQAAAAAATAAQVNLAAANAAAGKKAQRKASAKKTGKAQTTAQMNNLRAEAPEFVPTTSEWPQ